jgi:hypothetical protein
MSETATETAPAAPATEAAQPPAPQAAPAADATPAPETVDYWKARARQHEDRAKGNHEEVTRQGQALALIAEKLGLDLEGKPDPEKLQAALESSQRQHRSTAAELAVYRAASAAGADADALLDSRAFMASIEGIDPAAADYRQQVKDAATAFAEANPRYKSAVPDDDDAKPKRPPVARPSADFGTPPRSKQWTEADIKRASDAELDAAMKAGLLTEYGVGATKPSRYGRR